MKDIFKSMKTSEIPCCGNCFKAVQCWGQQGVAFLRDKMHFAQEW